MMFLHIVTEHFPPEHGGLEAWTEQFATSIAQQGHRVMVYVAGENWPGLQRASASPGIHEIISLACACDLLCEPIRQSSWTTERKALEYQRARFVVLANEISTRVASNPQAKHVLLSNFATGVGFLATTVAETFGMPHVLRIAGTDFSRGMRTPLERMALTSAIDGATHVVALNREQARVLASITHGKPISIIPTSIDVPVGRRSIYPSAFRGDLKLFADCGFSHKKATHLLLHAFAAVALEHPNIQLRICGGDERGQESYWGAQRSHWSEHLGEKVSFLAHISREQVHSYLSESDLYCSATLAEGASAARAAALCVGVPILTTICGEIIDVALEVSHVRLVPPGNLMALTDGLRYCLDQLANGRMKIDRAHVQACRDFFSLSRETNQWQELFACL